MEHQALEFRVNSRSGFVESVKLYGTELLETGGAKAEFHVNNQPLPLRLHPGGTEESGIRFRGERWVDHLCGWSLTVNRHIGHRSYMKFPCTAVRYWIRRETADCASLPNHGPGGPAIEAPLFADSFGVLNWNWKFWGENTRMIFSSSHSNGPYDESGHIGHEHDTPEQCKKFMQNAWRRTYPSSMVIHGGLFYDAASGHWLAITCRRPHLGYRLNIEDAGAGVGFDFLLHAAFAPGDNLRLPEIKFYYGRTRREMEEWLGWYATFYYQEPPEWVHRRLWGQGLAWDNAPTWLEQAACWEKMVRDRQCNAFMQSLVTNRPVCAGTLPFGYEPDPNHGPQEEFKAMCRHMRALDVPVVVWMSHSGLCPGAPDIDDDWFIRGIDGRPSAAWGSEDGGMFLCNPGHPGYIAYTKKWIHFYLVECGCKGIFFDCLSWVFPPDFRPRDFMRYPADTNVMAIRFQDEMYRYIKECDPDAVMFGEGASLDAAVNVFMVAGNPVRGIDGMGPRDFLLSLNRNAPKKLTIDSGLFLPGSGIATTDTRLFSPEENRFLLELLEHRDADAPALRLTGDVTLIGEEFLVFGRSAPPVADSPYFPPRDRVVLPEAEELRGLFNGVTLHPDGNGVFSGLKPGIYRIVRHPAANHDSR